jgi:nitrogen-specific signal transduction histidine kinase/CheY-like chemotaxis protein
LLEVSRAGEVSFEGLPATILLVRDTTDYQMAQEERARSEKLSALGSLAAGVAHEINNPLAYVALNLELLRESCGGVLTPQELEALEEAIGGVARMRDIAGELHAFSGRDPPGPPVPVDVSRAVSSALNLVNNEIRQRATLRRDLEPGAFALAREGQLVQVCVNLLVNAVHAIPTPSDREHVIDVTSRVGEGTVEIVISDTGVGIAQPALQRLFDPFATSKRRGEGAGLGLAICKRIIDDLGGSIRVDSALGVGTQVCVRLPEAPIPSAPEASPAPLRKRARTARLRILVVEDELPIARALEKLLHAHELVVASDGNAALALLEANARYDCILCDLMMPRLSGAAFCAALADRWPQLTARVAIITGGAITPDCREFLERFKGEVLRKPFSLDAAQQCIARVVASGGEPSIPPAPVVMDTNESKGTRT